MSTAVLPRHCVQVAGVLDAEEARMLDSAGVHLIGFPLRLPVNREDTTEEQAGAIVRETNISSKACLITYEQNPHEVAELCRRLDASFIQLHGTFSRENGHILGALLPTACIIKSLIVRGSDTAELETQIAQADFAHAFITDTFNPKTGATGATGLTHDWSVSAHVARLLERQNKPLILAGGLDPANVGAAIEAVRPMAVDAHTGLEDGKGRKSPELVRAFVHNATQAFCL